MPFRMPEEERKTSLGSGVIVGADGLVVTNNHVVERARQITVTTADRQKHRVTTVATDPVTDIAVLRIEGQNLSRLPWGDSARATVGEYVLAIGNPFQLNQTVTMGIISATGRSNVGIVDYEDFIQTDAAINPGNSGGPLLDSAGRLIGVNTQIASPSGASAGVGFAIPVDIVSRVVPEIIRYGRVIRPILGVEVWPDNVTSHFDLRGVWLREVPETSAAGKAGIHGTIVTRDGRIRQIGDLILKIEDLPTPGQNALLDALEKYKVGDEVKVTFLRDDQVGVVNIRLQAME